MEHYKKIKSDEGVDTLRKVKEICMKLPEVTEQVDSFGHTSFRVKDKPIVMMGENEEGVSIAIKTLPTTQEILLQQDGYYKTPYIGQHGWTSQRITHTLNWKEIEGLILEAYCRTAPKSLAREAKTQYDVSQFKCAKDGV